MGRRKIRLLLVAFLATSCSRAAPLDPELAAVNELVPRGARSRLVFERRELLEKRLEQKSYALPAPRGWTQRSQMFAELHDGLSEIHVGSNCDGVCAAKDWSRITERILFTPRSNDARVVVDEQTPGQRTMVTADTGGLRLTRVTMAWWTERSERYAFCTADLEPSLEESARAFVRACSSLRSLPLPEASVAAPTSYVAPGGMRRKVSHARAWRIDGAKVSEIIVQPGTHGLGEELRALWVAGDGTVFAGGDMETGEPGRNTAVVYRTALNGTLVIDHTKPQSEVWSISGTSSRDVYVAGENIFAHFDGAEWKDLAPPAGERVLHVYAADSNLWVSAVGGGVSRIFRRALGSDWKKEAEVDTAFIAELGGGPGGVVFATAYKIFMRRAPGGRWSRESWPTSRPDGGFQSAWAAGPNLIVGLGFGELSESRGGSAWRTRPAPELVSCLSGIGPDAYAVSLRKLFRRTNEGTWAEVADLPGMCKLLGGAAKTLVLVE